MTDVPRTSAPTHADPGGRPSAREPFADVVPRRSVDELFANAQQSLVSLTGQADLKANIVITGSSLILTIVATQWNDNSLRPGLLAVATGALLALLTAITVVL